MKKRTSRKKQVNKSLYDNGNKRSRIKAGYGSRKKAMDTVKKLKRIGSRAYKLQVANTMYNRAKYHKYQTDGMRDAMQVYSQFLKSIK